MLFEKLRCLRKSQKKFPPFDLDRAGSQGERLAHELLQSLLQRRPGKTRLFPSLRVPKTSSPGKYEIDLLLVSEQGILVIEVKHWGGSISRQGQAWAQERNGERKTHPDPVRLNREKLQALYQWLTRRGVRLSQQSLHSVVLFTNPQVSFSADIKKMPEVMTLETLPGIHLDSSTLPYAPVVNTLELLPTWDIIRLHGGRILHGDLEYIVMPKVKPSAMQRKYLRSARVKISRRWFPGLFLRPRIEVQDWNGRTTSHPLHPDARLVFRAAGRTEKEEISWLHIEAMELGWKDQTYYDGLSAP